MIPYGRQEVTEGDIDAVVGTLRSDFLTTGPEVARFEQALAARVGASHVVAVNSATSALHIACLALGVGSGDRLWTVPNTFVASANCGRYCGAEVDFVDIDPLTWNMSVHKLEEKLAAAAAVDRLPKVVVPVHFSGQPTEQERIWTLAREYGFFVLEDASHSVGAARDGEPVGNCRWSDITVFSFHPVKVITSGEGGAALTNSDELAGRMLLFRSHGITREASRFRAAEFLESEEPFDPGAWYYEQLELGFNYRMTDIHAALGASQLKRLDTYVDRRNALARRYDALLEDLPVQRPLVYAGNLSAFHLYVVRVEDDADGRHRRRVFDELRSSGIGANVHYLPVHLQPYYRDQGFTSGSFPEAEAHGRTAVTLPLYPTLSEVEQDTVVETLSRGLKNR
jgi:UDP-4-amino-4,6-dideoxy-N-acetyl-beta-L-altrosamine transaminase